MQNRHLRITLAQYDIAWENKAANIEKIRTIASQHTERTDLIILPEMCTTALTLNVETHAETIEGETMAELKNIACMYNLALCGSFLCQDSGKFYNRGFFITPDSSSFYDKRHLFRMGNEHLTYSGGKERLIIEYKGFNICLQICYDLRFPVWSRNVNNEYDLLIYVANWPESRKYPWTSLLTARSIENMCYTCGVNRVGKDPNNIVYAGTSMAVSPRGLDIIRFNNEGMIETITIDKEILDRERTKFPVWKDSDKFSIDK